MSAPPPQGPHGPNQGPYGPQQPGPYPGQPQGGPPQPPPGYGQQPPPQGPPPGGPGGPYGGAPQGPPPGYGQEPTGGSGGRKGLIIGGAIAGSVILIGGLIAIAVSSGSGEYGTLAEDQCDEILPESLFEGVSDGESARADGEFEEYGGPDDAHFLDCSVDFDDPEHSVMVNAVIHESGSREARDLAHDWTEELEELESGLDAGELGSPPSGTQFDLAFDDVMWQPGSLGDESVAVAMPSGNEYMGDAAAAYVLDQNAFFTVAVSFPRSYDFEPEDGISEVESLVGDVRNAIRSVNEAP